MSYNLTLFQNISGMLGYTNIINYHLNELFYVLFLTVVFIIAIISMIRNGLTPYQSGAVSAFIVFVPSILLSTQSFYGARLVPEWFVVILFLIIAICGTISFISKE